MKDSQILSSFQDPPELAEARARARALPLYDACHVGVVLRAVILVEAAMAVAALFGAADWREWLTRVTLLSAAAVPATLVWLMAACGLKDVIARLPRVLQHAIGIALGAAAGLVGCSMLAMASLPVPLPWLASACAGALFATVGIAALVLRAKGRMPADTTARLSELQARIRPHFLFNTLNTAIALVRGDPARAEAVLEDLSDLFRHALADPREAVTLEEEVELARRYLEIEEVRFGKRLQIEWSLDPQAASAKVPPLLLQPLVENAVKHGVEPSTTGAQVKVSTQRRGATVVIKVTNTVPAGQGAPGHGLAQHNVRERLRLLHDVQAQFRTVLKDGVYQVRMEVPA
ncbi:MAG TPA: histidine kinase [Ramlibacter sp.]|uniref:sensor histidine kinase n=1 Tax=Ramlibacter sp. TaxID=1917967 RepID=UPI002D4FE7FE|nr:histidine kinase [Ramlibacter sp.]HZY20290.1 histidine kinase [Ramlibacter sp.]